MRPRKYKIKEDFFDNIDNEINSYILGFLYADGAINLKNYNICLSLAIKDKQILEKIKNYIFLDDKFIIKDYQLKNKFYSRLDINSKYMINSLIKIGCTPKKSLTLTFPILNENIVKHFIRGYFDGDGTINYKQKCVMITSTLSFCTSLQEIIYKYIGLECQIYKYKNVHRFTIHGRNKVLHFCKWLYSDANEYMMRKYEIYLNILNEKSKYFSNETIEKFIKYRNDGYTYQKIAQIFNCSERGISKAIFKYKNKM